MHRVNVPAGKCSLGSDQCFVKSYWRQLLIGVVIQVHHTTYNAIGVFVFWVKLIQISVIDPGRADWGKLGARYCGRAGCCDLPLLKFSGSQEHESRLSLPMRPNLILPTFLASQTIV